MSFLRSIAASCLVGIVGILLLTMPGHAQVTTGSIVGTVTDASGAAIPNATVRIVNTQTAIGRTVTSSGVGEFGANLLEPGSYNVTVTVAGFKKFEVTNLVLDVGRTERVTAALTIGAAVETVTVSGDIAASLQVDSATVQASIDTKSVQDLPLNGRNFVNLVQQTPGVNPGNPGGIAAGGHPDDRRDSSSVSANGQGSEFNNQQVDGLDNNERQQGLLAVRPSIDAISEVRVLTNNFPAEVGRAAGAVVDVVTKAGGNQFHGSAFEFFRNDIFDARDFFAKAGQVAKPELRQNEFGGSVGGPIWKNKTFFFAAYEGQRRVQGQTFVETIPTAFEEANPGNFSDYTTPSTTGGAATPGPVIPTAALNPISLSLYQLYPTPNISVPTDNGIPLNNFVSSPRRTLYSTNVDARVDHHFNDNNTAFVHYSYNPTTTYTPARLPTVTSHGFQIANTGADNFGDSFGDIAGPSIGKAQGIYGDFVHVFTPKLAMEVKAGFTRLVIKSNTQNFGENISDAYGFPNSNLGTPDTTGLANILFFTGPYASLGDSYFEPLYDTNNTPQVNGTVTYTRGAHNIKLGAAFIKRELNYFVDPFSPQGGFAFFGFLTGNPELDFLTGLDLFSLRGNLLTSPGFRTSEPSAFVQDDWRVTPTLTLNLGVRYDVFTPFTEAHNKYSNFNRVTGMVDIAGQGTSSALGVKTDYKDFQPRFGFAKQLPESAVIRGGYSMVYFPVDYQNVIQNPNPPYTFECIGCANSFAAYPNLPNPVGPSTTNPAGTLFYKDPHFQASYMHMFNMAVEKQVGNNTFTLGYVGEIQIKQLYQGDLNRPDNVVTNVPTTQAAPAAPAFKYATLSPLAQDITYDYNGGHGNYNALQASVVRRAGKGLTFFANYTWARGLSNGITQGTTTDETGLVPRDPNYDYGPSDFNIQNRFAGSVNWQIPFGRSLNGFKRTAVYGWQTNILSFWETGLPQTVNSGVAAINLPDVTGDRPDQIADNHVANPSIGEWFNTSAYRVQQFYGQAGTEQVNSVYGPHDRRVDFSLFKDFALYRESNLQFRAEVFNVSNTPNFGQPDIGLQDATFGQINSTRINEFPRQLQFALKYNF